MVRKTKCCLYRAFNVKLKNKKYSTGAKIIIHDMENNDTLVRSLPYLSLGTLDDVYSIFEELQIPIEGHAQGKNGAWILFTKNYKVLLK